MATFIEITPSDLELRDDDDVVRIALGRVQSLERSLGERRRFGRNFLITTGVGALALATWAAATDTEQCNDGPFGCLGAGENFMLGFVVGGIISAPIGLIVGLSIRSERWEPTTLSLPAGVSLILAPLGAGRLALGASVSVGPGW